MSTALFVFFYLFLYISLIGALNWGLIGVFKFNLVEFVSNRSLSVERGLYIFVGFSAIVLLILSIIVLSYKPEGFALPAPTLREEYDDDTEEVILE